MLIEKYTIKYCIVYYFEFLQKQTKDAPLSLMDSLYSRN